MSRRRQIDRSNTKTRLVQSLNDLLRKELRFFNSTLRVRMAFEEFGNRGRNDGVQLMRIVHSISQSTSSREETLGVRAMATFAYLSAAMPRSSEPSRSCGTVAAWAAGATKAVASGF